MCSIACVPIRSKSRVEIIPVKRITKAKVEEIIASRDFECFFKREIDSDFQEYEDCVANLLNILHDGKTKVKIAGSRTPGYISGEDTVVMTAPCVKATILLRTNL